MHTFDSPLTYTSQSKLLIQFINNMRPFLVFEDTKNPTLHKMNAGVIRSKIIGNVRIWGPFECTQRTNECTKRMTVNSTNTQLIQLEVNLN